MGRLELPASCSQSKRATNCATPGYGIFQLWSNMWSTPIFDQLPAMGEVLSAQVSQEFRGFPRAAARTWASRSQKRFSAFFIVVYSNLSSFLLQPSYFLAILFPLFPCIPALSVVLHVVSGKVSARIPAPQWHPRWYNLPQSLKNGTSISKNIQDFFERKPINFCVAISKKTSVKNSPQKSAVVSEAMADFLECSIATGARIL